MLLFGNILLPSTPSLRPSKRFVAQVTSPSCFFLQLYSSTSPQPTYTPAPSRPESQANPLAPPKALSGPSWELFSGGLASISLLWIFSCVSAGFKKSSML